MALVPTASVSVVKHLLNDSIAIMEWDDNQLLTDLFKAYRDARKNKRTSRSQLGFEINLEHNLVVLYEQLKGMTYKPSPCVCFISHFPVKREVFASQFKDRVVHHLLYNYLNPIFEPKMIFDSYSCRKDKGTLFGIKRLEHHIRSVSDNYQKSAYVLKLDIKGYFMSIPKQKLFEIVSRKIHGDDSKSIFLRYLTKTIIFNDPRDGCFFKSKKSEWNGLPASKSLFCNADDVGLPIGDLTSQMFSNIFLNELDQYIKRTLKCTHYGRYVDDFYIVDRNPICLKQLVPQIRNFLSQELGLTLHPKKIVLQHISKGIPFLGAYIRPYYLLPSKRSISAFKTVTKRLDSIMVSCGQKKVIPYINSYLGYFSHYRHYHMVLSTILKTNHLKYLLYNRQLTIAYENTSYNPNVSFMNTNQNA